MENIFDVRYNEKLDKLEVAGKKEKNRIYKFIIKHKFFSITLSAFICLCGINFYLIYNFIKILEKI